MKRSVILKMMSIVQITALVICTFAYSPLSVTAQTTTTTAPQSIEDILNPEDAGYVQTLQQQSAALQHEANSLQRERQFYSDSLEGLIKQKDNIKKQIELKRREIDINTQIMQSLDQQLNTTDEELIRAEQDMLLKRQTLLTRFEALRKKLRSLSKHSGMTAVQMMLSSESYVGFLVNLKMASRITTADQAMLTELEDGLQALSAQRDTLLQEQQQIEQIREPYEQATENLKTTHEELLALHEEATAVEELLSNNENYYRTQFMQLIIEQQTVQNQLNEVLGRYDMSGVIAPSVMQWPTPDCTIITSSFKARWGKWHYGLDIACFGDATGKPIYPAADGTVIFAGTDDSGYGNYVIIDHGYDILGNHIVTLYGHCHELLVNEGAVVIGGQTTIATVGNSGRSEGAHLHFEVRVNENAVDPVGNGYLLTDSIIIAD